MNDQELAAAFNEWMRLYIDDPRAFAVEWKTVNEFLTETEGGEPSYGQQCVAMLKRCHERLSATGTRVWTGEESNNLRDPRNWQPIAVAAPPAAESA